MLNEIIAINHIGLRVSDLERSRTFYEQFGFEFIIGPVGPEPVAIMEHPSGININFILNAHPNVPHNILMDIAEEHAGYTHVALTVNNIERVQEYLETQRIQITEGPIMMENGAKMLFIRDPDRNVIEFHQNPDGFVSFLDK